MSVRLPLTFELDRRPVAAGRGCSVLAHKQEVLMP